MTDRSNAFSTCLAVAAAVALGTGCGLLHRQHKNAPPYWVTDLGPLPGGKTSRVIAMNDAGDVVGRADFAGSQGHQHAVLWPKGKAPIDLGTLDGGGSEADHITSGGKIYGWSSAPGDIIQAVEFANGAKPVDLDSAGTVGLSVAASANDAGSVLITKTTPQATMQSYLYSGGEQPVDVVAPTGTRDVMATDLNSVGDVVGIARYNTGKRRAFLWSGSSMTDLAMPDGCNESFAYGINRRRRIVGSCSETSEDLHAVLWDDGSPVDLSTPAKKESEALAINDSGEVVGSCNNHACLWKKGGLYDLDSMIGKHSEVVLHRAIAINNAGQIACNGTVNGQFHAFLLTPSRNHG